MKNYIFFPIIFILSIIMYAGCTPESDMLESKQEIVSTDLDLIPVNAEVLPELLKNEDFRPLIKEVIKLSNSTQIKKQQFYTLISLIDDLKLKYDFQYISQEQMAEMFENELLKILMVKDQMRTGNGKKACFAACLGMLVGCMATGGGIAYCTQMYLMCIDVCDDIF